MRTSVEKMLTSDKPDSQGVGSLTLAYRVKLYPSRVKGDLLGMLCTLFQREHHKALDLLDGIVAQEGNLSLKGKSQAGAGEFKQRVRYRAANDYKRARKAAKALKRQMKLPYLQAELCDAFEVQAPKKAQEFELWFHAEGMPGKSKNCQLYLPARTHKALNAARARPNAKLSKAAQVFRKDKNWYAIVYVKCPLPEQPEPKKWLGVDVGVRSAVTRSDGYRGPDLRPILVCQKTRTAGRQRQGHPADFGQQTPQKQAIAIEAKKLVSVASASGCGIAMEDPKRLPRYKQWAGRFLARRLDVLAALAGVPIRLVPPAYTSLTCSCYGGLDTFREKAMFRCRACGFTHNADQNASRNIRHWGSLLRSA